MKNTKTLLMVLLVLFIEWLICGLIGHLLGDVSFKYALTHPGTFLFLIVLGWIPVGIVATDYYDTL